MTQNNSLGPNKVTEALYKYLYSDVANQRKLSILAVYSIYTIIVHEFRRYAGKTLTPLESHTSPDMRSKSLGDIEIKNSDGSCFEAIKIKHLKPISTDMLQIAYRKFKNTQANRYYILTTSEPNYDDQKAVFQKIEDYKRLHPCEIVTNGVIPSLKYYLRLVNQPQAFIEEYTKWLEFEYQRASGIKKEHLQVWQEIRRTILTSK